MPFKTGAYLFSFVYNGYLYAASGISNTFYRYNGTWTNTGINISFWEKNGL